MTKENKNNNSYNSVEHERIMLTDTKMKWEEVGKTFFTSLRSQLPLFKIKN